MTNSQKGILEMLAQNASIESISNCYKNPKDFDYLKIIGAIIYVGCELAGNAPIRLEKGPNFIKYYSW